MKLIDVLNWRFATQRMTGEKLDDKIVNTIIEAARLSPSSAELQTIHLFVISDPLTKVKTSPLQETNRKLLVHHI